MTSRGEAEVPLTVSVIIKTLNEAKRIGAAIDSALTALAGRDGEVIVADSGSTDDTTAIAATYPVLVVEVRPPARGSCGLGPQMGFQYARGDYVCVMDGDMLLDPSFVADALAALAADPTLAGVTGHVEEMQTANLEYARRVTRAAPENRIGDIDRMNGGGLYRRAAIDSVGYLTDRNLHGYEEYELGIRLRAAGWHLTRLDRCFVRHFGHTGNSSRLLARRWKSRYLMGIGELVRAACGQPYLTTLWRELPELRLWSMVYVWWALTLLLLVAVPDKGLALALAVALLLAVLALLVWRKRGVRMGLYTLVTWLFHAAALPVGLLSPRRPPGGAIESAIVRDGRP